MQHNQLAETLKSALKPILETGCLIKDLDVGSSNFPAVIQKKSISAGKRARIASLYPIARTRLRHPQTRSTRATLAL